MLKSTKAKPFAILCLLLCLVWHCKPQENQQQDQRNQSATPDSSTASDDTVTAPGGDDSSGDDAVVENKFNGINGLSLKPRSEVESEDPADSSKTVIDSKCEAFATADAANGTGERVNEDWKDLFICAAEESSKPVLSVPPQSGDGCAVISNSSDADFTQAGICPPQGSCLLFIENDSDGRRGNDKLNCLSIREAIAAISPAPNIASADWENSFICTVKEPVDKCDIAQFEAPGETSEEESGPPRVRVEGLKWVFNGNVDEQQNCTHVYSQSDSGKWAGTYLCADKPHNIAFHSQTTPTDASCIHFWDDRFPDIWKTEKLCFNKDENLCLAISHSGLLADMDCQHMYNPEDTSATWENKYICTKKPDKDCPITGNAGPANFDLYENLSPVWSYIGSITNKYCIQFFEDDPDAWHDNYLCLGNFNVYNHLKYSYQGIPSGYEVNNCVNINEPLDTHKDLWINNYLCAKEPYAESLCLRYSHQGKIPNMDCLNIHEPANDNNDADKWSNNYICIRKKDGECPAAAAP